MDDSDMTGRVVVVTGGAGAVGSTVSKRWLDAGARVLIVDHRQSTIDGWKAQYLHDSYDGRIATHAGDVSNEAGAKEMVGMVENAFGQSPDTLIHLVGGFGMAKVEDETAPQMWDRMMAINLSSSFHCYRAMLPALRTRGGGWIVGLSSRAAHNPGAGISAYAASKAGLVALTVSLSAEVRRDGIHVNLIVASTIDTQANRRDMGEDKAKDWVTPDDIADATFYLCSDSARSVHGATLEVFANA